MNPQFNVEQQQQYFDNLFGLGGGNFQQFNCIAEELYPQSVIEQVNDNNGNNNNSNKLLPSTSRHSHNQPQQIVSLVSAQVVTNYGNAQPEAVVQATSIAESVPPVTLEEAQKYANELKRFFMQEGCEDSPLVSLNECVTYIENKIAQAQKKTKKKSRTKNPEKYAANVKKLKRNSGQEYVNKRGIVPARKMVIRPCCQGNCQDKIPLTSRQQLFHDFWNMADFRKQNFYLNAVVEREPPKRRKRNPEHRRAWQYKFFLIHGEQKTRVCRTFFLDTFNISEGRLGRALSQPIPGADFRGKKPNNKTPEALLQGVMEHVTQFVDYIKHYERPQANAQTDANSATSKSNQNLDLRKLYLIYAKKHDDANLPHVKECIYRRVFKSDMNLQLEDVFTSKELVCQICNAFRCKLAQISEDQPEEKTKLQSQMEAHLANAEIGRKAFENYQNSKC